MEIFVLDITSEKYRNTDRKYPSKLGRALLWYALTEAEDEEDRKKTFFLEPMTLFRKMEQEGREIADFDSYETMEEVLHQKLIIGEKGKPVLENGPWFSISHSGCYIGVAVSRKNPIGIDIESETRIRYYQNVSTRFFSEEERKALSHLSEQEAGSLFIRQWCRKEAIGKRDGCGLTPEVLRLNTMDPERDGEFMEMVLKGGYRLCICK